MKIRGVRESIGLKRGTVTVQPHRIEWDTASQEVISELKNILKDDVVDAGNDIQTHFVHVVIWGQKVVYKRKKCINRKHFTKCRRESLIYDDAAYRL